ncbi:Hsp20/alpha crystallin family protein [Pollutibacter soli]|uniref:Hsp20/alpha crystallin family protein n=1 Tax=Pollutibacter soli TaxID=3034157 RepID=UPI003013C357
MSSSTLARLSDRMPSLFNDFFKPWNELYDNDSFFGPLSKIPAVNITEHKHEYLVALAAPGMKKEDFKIDMDGNILTISSEKEETKEEKEKKFTRKEYNYSSFSRSFTVPEEIIREKIEARYENGILNISLPRKDEPKKAASKQISVK